MQPQVTIDDSHLDSQAGRGRQTGDVPPLAAYWVRLVLGFGVSVAVGLAPYLGSLHIPLFAPMLSLIPASVQPIAIPVSATSMGIIAILVQWYGSVKPGRLWLRAMFGRTLAVCFLSFIALVAIEMVAVVRVDVPATNSTVSFAVGLGKPSAPPCVALGRADCIRHKLGLDEALIDSYFGENAVNTTKLSLVLSYVAFMSSFGALVGLLLLIGRPELSRENSRSRKVIK